MCMIFPVFSSYSLETSGRSSDNKIVDVTVQVPKRVNDILKDFYGKYMDFCRMEKKDPKNEALYDDLLSFSIKATAGHLDMFGKVVKILNKFRLIEKDSFQLSIETLIGKKGPADTYDVMVAYVDINLTAKVPTLEQLLGMVDRDDTPKIQ